MSGALEELRFERLERLGSGGMAVVWRALDRKLRREVALKELREEIALHGDGLARFKHEAEAIARLNHPGIVAPDNIHRGRCVIGVVFHVLEGGDVITLPRPELPVTEPEHGRYHFAKLVGILDGNHVHGHWMLPCLESSYGRTSRGCNVPYLGDSRTLARAGRTWVNAGKIRPSAIALTTASWMELTSSFTNIRFM